MGRDLLPYQGLCNRLCRLTANPGVCEVKAKTDDLRVAFGVMDAAQVYNFERHRNGLLQTDSVWLLVMANHSTETMAFFETIYIMSLFASLA